MAYVEFEQRVTSECMSLSYYLHHKLFINKPWNKKDLIYAISIFSLYFLCLSDAALKNIIKIRT